MNQDFVAWVGQGRIADRTKEKLGVTDRGIVMMRRLLKQSADDNRAGKPLPGIDPTEQHVRSCSLLLPKEQAFKDHARHGWFPALGTDPVTV